jgi:hypothetical protein
MPITSLFYDYIDADGVNVIKFWLDQLDPVAKAKVITRLSTLEQLDRTEWIRTDYVEILTGDKDGLIAVRIQYKRIQYRLLGWDGPNRGELTLLAPCTEKNDRYIPRSIGDTAFERRAVVLRDPATRRIRHDFG